MTVRSGPSKTMVALPFGLTAPLTSTLVTTSIASGSGSLPTLTSRSVADRDW